MEVMKKNLNYKEDWRVKLKNLPVATKLYPVFIILSLCLLALIGGLFVACEADALSALVKIILVFLTAYIFCVALITGYNSMYNYERNLVAGLVPLLMPIMGLALAFLLYNEYLSEHFSGGAITIALLAFIVTPLIGFLSARALSISQWKLYFLSLAQIIISCLIAWLEFVYLI